jgi:hypothetical protein
MMEFLYPWRSVRAPPVRKKGKLVPLWWQAFSESAPQRLREDRDQVGDILWPLAQPQ